MSAREWRAVREGEAHAASKTSTNNTPESFIVGVGASGALLAGAAIVFVTLVGLVSFNVWPTGHEISVDGSVELSQATGGGSAANPSVPLSAAAGQLASASAPTVSGGGASNSGAGNGGQGGGNGGKPKGGLNATPPATAPPTDTSTGGSGGSGDSSGPPSTATKDPTGPVYPTHPDIPHRNGSNGTNGKDDPNSGSDNGIVTGTGPFNRPSPPSSSDSGSGTFAGGGNGNGRGHGSPRFRH